MGLLTSMLDSTPDPAIRGSEGTLPRSGTFPDAATHGSPHLHVGLHTGPSHLDPHGSSIQGNSVVLLQSFHGVASSVKRDLSGAETPSTPVVVNIGQLEAAELSEKLVDIRVGDTEVQVGDNELAGGGETAPTGPHASATSSAAGPVHVVVPLSVRVPTGVTVTTCASTAASESSSTSGTSSSSTSSTSTTLLSSTTTTASLGLGLGNDIIQGHINLILRHFDGIFCLL